MSPRSPTSCIVQTLDNGVWTVVTSVCHRAGLRPTSSLEGCLCSLSMRQQGLLTRTPLVSIGGSWPGSAHFPKDSSPCSELGSLWATEGPSGPWLQTDPRSYSGCPELSPLEPKAAGPWVWPKIRGAAAPRPESSWPWGGLPGSGAHRARPRAAGPRLTSDLACAVPNSLLPAQPLLHALCSVLCLWSFMFERFGCPFLPPWFPDYQVLRPLPSPSPLLPIPSLVKGTIRPRVSCPNIYRHLLLTCHLSSICIWAGQTLQCCPLSLGAEKDHLGWQPPDLGA